MRNVIIPLLLGLAACRRSTPPVEAPAATDRPVAAPTSDRPTAVDPLDLVRARGPLHGAAFRLGPGAAGIDVTLAFTGTSDVAWGAWVIIQRDQGPELHPVEQWPTGVKVVTLASDRDTVYAVVETVATLDRAAGQRTVIVISGDRNSAGSWQAASAPVKLLQRVRELTDTAAVLRVTGETSGPTLTEPRCDAVRAAHTPAALATVASATGIEHFARYPDGLVLRVGVLDRAAVALSPSAPAIVEVLSRTVVDACDTDDLRVVDEPGGLRVASAITPAVAPAPLARTGVARVVTAGGDPAEVERALRARYAGNFRVHAVAPLGAQGGSVAVASVEAFDASVVVVTEQGVSRVLPLGRAVNIDVDRPEAVRFVDADGDGRTDVAVETSHEGAIAHRGLYLTPPPSMAIEVAYDLASAIVMNTAASLDAAVEALSRVPWRGVTVREACPLMLATRNLAGLRRVGTADLRVVTFEEPGAIAWRAEYHPLTYFTAEQPFSGAVVGCGGLTCERDRPVCTGEYAEEGPGSTAYWFAWENNRLKLSAVAVYTGS